MKYLSESTSNNQREINQQLIKSTIEDEEFWQLICTYINDTECHSYSKEDLLNTNLSQLFQIPQVIENNTVMYNDSIWHSFLIDENKILAIVNFVVQNSTVFYTISESYTHEINSAESATLQMYFYNDSFCCNGIKSGRQAVIEGVNKIDLNEISSNSKSVSQEIAEIFQTRSVTNISGGEILSDYPVFYQGTAPLCWAGTIASMVKYEYPSTYSNITISDVCSAINCYSGANWDQIKNALKYYFKSPYSVDTVESYLTKAQIRTAIGNNDPALMSSLNSNGEGAYITALIGYQETYDSMRIKIMNPGTGAQEWGNYRTASPFTYTYNGDTYKWDKSIRLLYIL